MPRAWPNLEASTFASTRELFILTAAQSREVDRLALSEFGLPTLVLMENAARAVADVALDALEDTDHPAVLILAGPGNNGGDALAAAATSTTPVPSSMSCSHTRHHLQGDCALHLHAVQHMGIPVRTWNPAQPLATTSPALIIGGLFGTGLARWTQPPPPSPTRPTPSPPPARSCSRSIFPPVWTPTRATPSASPIITRRRHRHLRRPQARPPRPRRSAIRGRSDRREHRRPQNSSAA
jgi:hypothetical protein